MNKIFTIFALFIHIHLCLYSFTTNNTLSRCLSPSGDVDEPSGQGFISMKLIPLTQDKFAMVDDADFDWLSSIKWWLKTEDKKKGKYYAQRGITNNANGKPSSRTMHREIMGVTDPSIIVDHKDRNGLNNQRSNLRFATPFQSSINKSTTSASGYMGVYINNWNRKYTRKDGSIGHYFGTNWRAQIKPFPNSKTLNLGTFSIKEDAAMAYDEAARKYHGEFAYQNFPII